MIICGFAGIGKSYLAKNQLGVVDLESTPFNKDWDTYARVAIHMANNGYTVLLSCHKELRDKLKEKKINYLVAIPDKSQKDEYVQRYRDRGNSDDFINMMYDNFEKFVTDIEQSENVLHVPSFLSLPKP